ncbi:V-type ATP synthase subunit D [Fusibacter sp. JL216-2]|uniref:V-type ATP synthase subunit D n=1 Tax=Fusibacter sp. JL216-2 TaxID=3071453 RepID=UPI003D33EA08
MNQNQAPTKANLLKAKSLLGFSNKGFDLLDKKRNVLIREMMGLIDRASTIQKEIKQVYKEAYEALRFANVTLGLNTVEEISISIPNSEDYQVLLTSVMGVEIPEVRYKKDPFQVSYGFYRTNAALDTAVRKFRRVRFLTYELAEVETKVYKLAMEIKKTQKRANALEKIQIPKYKALVKNIEETLEEKEREDFFRLKRVKSKSTGK